MSHIYYHSPWEVNLGGLGVQSHPQLYCIIDISLNNMRKTPTHLCVCMYVSNTHEKANNKNENREN